MEKVLEEKIELTIDNYRSAKELLRNDGEILNHFESLIYAKYDMELPLDRIKEIRKYIKSVTPKLSPFRGDILYIISILISRNSNDYIDLIEKMCEVYGGLVEEGFEEGPHTALASYVVAEYRGKKSLNEVVEKMKTVFSILKDKYNAITHVDDYLVCALWAINDIDVDTINEFIDTIYNQFTSLNIKSKNGIQGITNAIMLNESSGHMYRTMEFMLQLDKRKIKIAHQFLPLVGVLPDLKSREYADRVEGVISYLCYEESEYEFYMDKGFRTIIAMVIIASCIYEEKLKYMDELFAHGVFCFIKSKNNGILSEVAGFEG